MNKKILVIVSGKLEKIKEFKEVGEDLGLDVTLASFSDVNYSSFENSGVIFIDSRSAASYNVIYFRMVGKRIEDASLLALYCKKNRVRVVDRVYTSELLFPSSIAKSIENKKLIEAGIAIPKTIYGSVSLIFRKAKKEFGYPFVVKSTSGRKARDAWFIDSLEKEKELVKVLADKEKSGMRFFGQEFIKAGQRERVLVIGDKAVAAITRPTKWRKKYESREVKQNPEGVKSQIRPIPSEYVSLSLSATKAVDLEIAGVDILRQDNTDRLYVLEVNAAPSWKLIEKDCNINVEEKILEYLAK